MTNPQQPTPQQPAVPANPPVNPPVRGWFAKFWRRCLYVGIPVAIILLSAYGYTEYKENLEFQQRVDSLYNRFATSVGIRPADKKKEETPASAGSETAPSSSGEGEKAVGSGEGPPAPPAPADPSELAELQKQLEAAQREIGDLQAQNTRLSAQLKEKSATPSALAEAMEKIANLERRLAEAGKKIIRLQARLDLYPETVVRLSNELGRVHDDLKAALAKSKELAARVASLTAEREAGAREEEPVVAPVESEEGTSPIRSTNLDFVRKIDLKLRPSGGYEPKWVDD